MAPATLRRSVKGFVILTLAFRQENKQWVGECLELGTSTFARTFKQVHRELIELVELDLNTLEQIGDRERFFKEHGIKFYSDDVPPDHVTKTLPVGKELLMDQHPFPVPAGA